MAAFRRLTYRGRAATPMPLRAAQLLKPPALLGDTYSATLLGANLAALCIQREHVPNDAADRSALERHVGPRVLELAEACPSGLRSTCCNNRESLRGRRARQLVENIGCSEYRLDSAAGAPDVRVLERVWQVCVKLRHVDRTRRLRVEFRACGLGANAMSAGSRRRTAR
jgi:hypothetical protein